jgi:hypothetical protein
MSLNLKVIIQLIKQQTQGSLLAWPGSKFYKEAADLCNVTHQHKYTKSYADVVNSATQLLNTMQADESN